MIIETERLIMRPFEEADLQDFNEYASVPGVGEAAGWPHHQSIDESKKILQMFLDDSENHFALYHRADKKVIGAVGLKASWVDEDDEYKHLKAREIGYVISKDYWGVGFATEATKAIIDYGFNTLGLDAYTICHFKENAKSKRVIEKCGFTFVKQDVFYAKPLDKHFDDMKYILLKP